MKHTRVYLLFDYIFILIQNYHLQSFQDSVDRHNLGTALRCLSTLRVIIVKDRNFHTVQSLVLHLNPDAGVALLCKYENTIVTLNLVLSVWATADELNELDDLRLSPVSGYNG